MNIGLASFPFLAGQNGKTPGTAELAAFGCCDSGSMIEVWDPRSGAELFSPRLDGQATSIAFSPDGRVLGTGTFDGKIVLWNAHDGGPIGSPIVVGGHRRRVGLHS